MTNVTDGPCEVKKYLPNTGTPATDGAGPTAPSPPKSEPAAVDGPDWTGSPPTAPIAEAAGDPETCAATGAGTAASTGASPPPSPSSATTGSSSAGQGILPLTDTGNAERFVAQHVSVVRYVGPWNSWLTNDGKRWARDHARRVEDLAKQTVRSIQNEVSLARSADEAVAILGWAQESEERRKRDAMVALARSEPVVGLSHEVLDVDPWAFNAQNGTVDLRTGALRPHCAEDYITKIAPVVYDPDATCPAWEAFLRRVSDEDEAWMSFMRRAVGYTLTGSVREHALLFMLGKGRNGKTTFLGAIQHIMGGYAIQAAHDLLVAHRGEVHPTSQADLFRVRLAVCSEVEEGAVWNASQVKRLTGGNRVRARRMREDFWEFSPSHKFWIDANHEPILRRHDAAFGERLKLVPFDIVIPKRERDKDLPAKLQAEAAGILAWGVRGCQEWLERGLDAPERVVEATETYCARQDQVVSFFSEVCEARPGAWTTCRDLVRVYAEWCRLHGEEPGGVRYLGDGLERLGFARDRKRGKHYHRGLVVREDWQDSDDGVVRDGAP